MTKKRKTPKPRPKPRVRPAHYVHVNSMTVKRNRVSGAREPPIIVRKGRSGKSCRGKLVEILDVNGVVVATVEYAPDDPLPCGSVLYIVAPHGARIVQDRASAAQSVLTGSCPTG